VKVQNRDWSRGGVVSRVSGEQGGTKNDPAGGKGQETLWRQDLDKQALGGGKKENRKNCANLENKWAEG